MIEYARALPGEDLASEKDRDRPDVTPPEIGPGRGESLTAESWAGFGAAGVPNRRVAPLHPAAATTASRRDAADVCPVAEALA